MSTVRRQRREHGELEINVLAHLRTEPSSTSVRAVGVAVGIPAGTAQQVLLRLWREGKIQPVNSGARSTLWRVVSEVSRHGPPIEAGVSATESPDDTPTNG